MMRLCDALPRASLLWAYHPVITKKPFLKQDGFFDGSGMLRKETQGRNDKGTAALPFPKAQPHTSAIRGFIFPSAYVRGKNVSTVTLF